MFLEIEDREKKKKKSTGNAMRTKSGPAICPRGNNKVVIIIFHVYDKFVFLMLELY
jgi:hypothetical protein